MPNKTSKNVFNFDGKEVKFTNYSILGFWRESPNSKVSKPLQKNLAKLVFCYITNLGTQASDRHYITNMR